MAASRLLDDVDLNNASNRELYSQLLLFKNDLSKNDLIFTQRSNPEQRTLQTIAHSLSLEYEYTSASKTIRICRPTVLDTPFSENVAHEQVLHDPINFYNLPLDLFDSNLWMAPSDRCTASFPDVDFDLSCPSMPSEQLEVIETFVENSVSQQHPGWQESAFLTPAMDLQAGISIPNQNSVESTGLLPLSSIISDTNNYQNASELDQIDPLDVDILRDSSNWDTLSSRCTTCNAAHGKCCCPADVLQNLELIDSTAAIETVDVAMNIAPRNQLSSGGNPATNGAVSKRKNPEHSSASESDHEADGDDMRPYRCDICPRRYFKAEQISRHRKTDHEDAKIKYFCSSCTSTFDRRMHLIQHRISCKEHYDQRNQVSSEDLPNLDLRDYDEMVFDSRSVQSGGSQSSAASGGSAGSGRRGPLSRMARAGMRAVKKVGACWRCKIFKKSVTATPSGTLR